MGLQYTMKAVEALTGVNQHTIRAWERRHNAFSPSRTGSNRRTFGEEDIVRLTLLRDLVAKGHSIGQIASMTTQQLQESTVSSLERTVRHAPQDQSNFSGCALSALTEMDTVGLSRTLNRAVAALGVWRVLEEVIVPLITSIEDGWEDSTLSIAHEHAASAIIRSFLEETRGSLAVDPAAPRIIITTPKNQIHELGACIVAVIAVLESWNVTYLGPNLPAFEIVRAVKQCSAKALALSVVYPLSDPDLAAEFTSMRAGLGQDFPILIGGRAATSYQREIGAIQGVVVQPLSEVKASLGRLFSECLGS
ncbi:MAG: cobalamin B12-binding domain-containing protein [Fimbriimonadaceae bacterium]